MLHPETSTFTHTHTHTIILKYDQNRSFMKKSYPYLVKSILLFSLLLCIIPFYSIPLHFIFLNKITPKMEKAMAPHSSTPAWKIPWTEEPGRLQSMGSLRVGHDWATSLSLFTFMHWRRKWQPTPVFLPGEPQGRMGCRLWGRTESDTTEAT